MSAADEGRTEQATSKQRQKFRDEGSVPRSQELSTLAQFLTGFAILGTTGGALFLSLGELMRWSYANMDKSINEMGLGPLAAFYFRHYVLVLAPLFAGLFFSVIIVSRFQFEFKISMKAIKPKFKKLNPFANIGKVLISKNSMMEMVKFTTKIAIMSLLAWIAIRPLTDEFASLFMFTPNQIGMIVWQYAEAIWLMIIAFMVVLGVGDYAWQRRQLEEKMKMTKDQVKDEHKQSQGDPKVKQRQRLKAMEMLAALMKQGAREADVVITNPTHFAVGLKYVHGQMTAPKVVARGVDHLALHIRRIARHAEIPIVENRSLARALYYSTEMGDEIPDRLFKPVAEILAFVYKLRKERKSA
ncbi:MAG: EscU/YscU/HrcU family type III secretion system export apparatus switch protein [Acidobacteriota bacterium]|nr:EscU/YscU/HrcU family type III secretion system export apparatus switch protein [Acidobacteriota bacterium]